MKPQKEIAPNNFKTVNKELKGITDVNEIKRIVNIE